MFVYHYRLPAEKSHHGLPIDEDVRPLPAAAAANGERRTSQPDEAENPNTPAPGVIYAVDMDVKGGHGRGRGTMSGCYH